MESPAKFPINLPRLVPVKSAKGQTVIQLYAEICHVQRGYGNSIFPLGETFSHSEINGGVARQIGPGILRLWRPVQPVREPRAVVHIARSIAVPGKTRIDAPVQCVSLIMVYRRISRRYVERAIRSNGCGTDQASSNGRGCLRDLMGIDEVELGAMPEEGGA